MSSGHAAGSRQRRRTRGASWPKHVRAPEERDRFEPGRDRRGRDCLKKAARSRRKLPKCSNADAKWRKRALTNNLKRNTLSNEGLLKAFVNEPYLDFSKPENAAAARAAWQKVRADLGKEYDLLIAGERRKSSAKLKSVNPSKPSEIVGGASKRFGTRCARCGGSGLRLLSNLERRAGASSAPNTWCRLRASSASASLSSTRGWFSKRARLGRKPKPMFRKPSTSASTMRGSR